MKPISDEAVLRKPTQEFRRLTKEIAKHEPERAERLRYTRQLRRNTDRIASLEGEARERIRALKRASYHRRKHLKEERR